MQQAKNIVIAERCRLLGMLSEEDLQYHTLERLLEHIVNTLKNNGHEAAEAEAKRIRLMLEEGMTEQAVLKELGLT